MFKQFRFALTMILLSFGFVVLLLLGIDDWQSQPAKATSDATQVGGVLDSDTTWRRAEAPYFVTADLLVDANVRLTIEAGVEVRFSQATALTVKGLLQANGNRAEPITFTSALSLPQPGDWRGIRFLAPLSTAQISPTGNLLQSVVVQYAGDPLTSTASPRFVVDANTSAVRIDQSIFRYNNGGGVSSDGDGIHITNNRFYSNTIQNITATPSPLGVLILAWGDHVVISGNHLVQNEFIFINNGMLGLGAGILSCGSDGVVTTNKIAQNQASHLLRGLVVSGVGSVATDNIILNNNGSGFVIGDFCGSSPSITNGSVNGAQLIIANNQIISNTEGVAAYNRDIDLRGNEIINNRGPAISLFNVTGKLTLNQIDGNNGGLWLQSSKPLISLNHILNNSGYSVQNRNLFDDTHLNIQNNWWGTTDKTVISAGIIDWFDDDTLGVVDYEPFLESGDSVQWLYLPLISR